MNETIELRTKTRELFESLDDHSRKALSFFIQGILEKDEENAFKEIVLLKLSPETFFEKSSYFWDTIIDETIIQKVCGDIISNYKKQNPECWLNASLDEFPENLVKDLSRDITLLKLIEKRIIKRFEAPIDLERLNYLLVSDDETKRFGGLRELGFTKKEADKFKSYTNSIWEYISEKILPEFKISAEIEEQEGDYDNIPNEEIKSPENLTAELIKHKEIIKELFDAANAALKASSQLGEVWVKAEKVGLNPEDILSKRLTLLDVLAAIGAI